MRHFAVASFWHDYYTLPAPIQKLADKNFKLLKADPRHPSLQFKKVGRLWAARVSRDYRALATEEMDSWFWIGTHAEYDELLK